ncbi:unnamed protein product [Anisakis simplex]|uniref:GtrA domain-containing protein n=1 Tax=Anisakis simplex TaxID=6269 RepID=A0A0M3KC05_ANISI|nr:unnamed protein product [Anisakis simplex]
MNILVYFLTMGLIKWLSDKRREALPRMSTRSLLSYYLPITGAVSHTLYTIHIFSPQILSRLFPICDLAVENSILSTSNLGVGFYVYFRPHLYRLDSWNRVQYSVFAAVMFNFGSLLTAVFIKALFPSKSNIALKSVVAIALSWFLLSRGHHYLKFLDTRPRRKTTSKNKQISEDAS